MNNNIINRIKEVAQEYMSTGVSADKAFELATEAVKLEQAAQAKPEAPAKPPRKSTGAPAPEKVAYENRKGKTIMCTPKQVARFEELKAAAPERKEKFDAMCAEWERKHAVYKPSEELIAAIKHDRAKVTKAIAESKYGFIGTKKELAALKEQVLAK